MSLFERKQPVQRLESELARLRDRAKLLDSKRAAAQADFDRATASRERFLLEGDLDDAKTAAKVQAAVETAVSALAGFDDSIRKQAALIAESEAKLAAERDIAERKAAAETLTAQILLVDETLPAWLQVSRNLAAGFEAMAHWRPECAQMAAFVRNAASEIENCVAITGDDLHPSVAAVRDGRMPIPRAPAAAEQPKPAPKPAPTTMLVFLTQHVAWYDDKGERHRATATHDTHLPLHLVAKARQIGAAHDIGSPERKKYHGTKTSAPPEWHWCKWLNDDPKAKSNVAPIMQPCAAVRAASGRLRAVHHHDFRATGRTGDGVAIVA
jgi:hypothetical protein